MGELHLEIMVDILRRTYKVEANVGAPQVAYRETLGRKSEIDYTHKKQTGGSGQFARIKLVFEPTAPGSGYVFESKVVGGAVPKEFIPGVEKGLEASRETGVLAGFPVIDFKVTLIDGAYHDVNSSVLAFEIAARAAFREGIAKAQCKLLEPIMKVEVVTPEDYMGDCIGDLNSRRGQIQGMDARGNAQVINAMVPLANMFGYVNTLRSMTQGRAAYTHALRSLCACAAGGRGRGRREAGRLITDSDLGRGRQPWRRRNSSGTSRTATSARSVTSIMARRR